MAVLTSWINRAKACARNHCPFLRGPLRARYTRLLRLAAEFVIHLAEQATSQIEFSRSLDSLEADFQDSFVANLWRLIQRFLKKDAGPAAEKKPEPSTGTLALLRFMRCGAREHS